MIPINVVAHECKVIRADQFNASLHSSSWRIVAMFQEDVLVYENQGQWNKPEMSTSTSTIQKRTFFLIAKTDSETVIQELREKLQISDHEADEARKKNWQAQNELKEATAKAESLQKEVLRSSQDLRAFRSERDELQEKKRMLERDLGRIRQAIGDLRLKEILKQD